MKLQGLTADRPLTHDLFASALESLGVRVDRVVISTLAEETYHARLHLERNGDTFEIDSRPSDALALAVRTGGRIFASEAVLEQAALGADAADEEGEGGAEGTPLESTGESVVDPRLDIFRDFVNSLDIDPETGEGRTRPQS
jgi:bifunctional DNase/RNase